MTNNVLVGVKDIGQRLFGGYAELLRIPHTARFSVGSVIACMPFPMVGMTITISVQHYYGNYSLAGALTAVQAIALAVASPVLGKLVDEGLVFRVHGKGTFVAQRKIATRSPSSSPMSSATSSDITR